MRAPTIESPPPVNPPAEPTMRRKLVKSKGFLVLVTATFFLILGMVIGGTSNPVAPSPVAKDCTAVGVTCTPADMAAAPSPAVTVAGPETTVTVTAAPAVPAAGTACDVAKEAILTGTPAAINAAMVALVADKTADSTAREYAQYYVGRDAGDKSMQTADVGLIQISCP
jgi:hypothetical protein